jgi:predicted P-loop ATPase/GTPase
MEFSRENKLETMADLNRAFADNLEIMDIPPDAGRQGILKHIQQTDDECFSILAAFNNAWLAYDHIRSDTELKIKVEDVWKMEVDRHREAFDECKNTMTELAKAKKVDLEPLLLRIKWL